MEQQVEAGEMSWYVVRMSFRLGASIRKELAKGFHLFEVTASDKRGRQGMRYKQFALGSDSGWILIPSSRKVKLGG